MPWSDAQARGYWSNRNTFLVFGYPQLAQNVAVYQRQLQQRINRENDERAQFTHEHGIPQAPNVNVVGVNRVTTISSNIEFWIKNNSWSYCQTCSSISPNILPYTYQNRPINKYINKCNCSVDNARYVVPQFEQVPADLVGLSVDDLNVLRPFYLFCGPYQRHPKGYRMKTSMIRLNLSEESVESKINLLQDRVQQLRCRNAYTYLMTSNTSRYSYFINLRENLLIQNKYLNIFNMEETMGIECALWPNLYPFENWCESVLSGGASRLSSKVSFSTKVFSEILDYSLHFELLQFQYDRWLYKIVSGAINTARFMKCSPAKALDNKTFSPTYWQWQHRFLLDAVAQFGLPDAFVTLSPFEWSFPFPAWLDDARDKVGKGPTQLSAFETMHIVQVLEQVVRGYLCGSNSKKWTGHLFSYNRLSTISNIKTYFYRFEFQQRGTVHLHLLVWLKDMTKMQHQFVRADFAPENPNLNFYVRKYQPSDKPSPCLFLQNRETFFENRDGNQILHLKHPAEEFQEHLRAYISTLTPALKCCMDFQITDGRAMLLRYVTSYVTKWQDGISADSLYSYRISGGQAARRYVSDMKPSEPEMWLALSSKKIAWSSSRTKQYTVPRSDTAADDKTAIKYRGRPQPLNNYSFLEWLRFVDHKKRNPQTYKHGNTLVGLKVLSFYNPQFLYQYVLMHLPHTDIAQVQHPDHQNIPCRLQWYAAAIHHFPNLFLDNNNLQNYLNNQGHRNSYITTAISYISSLNDMFFLWQMQIINPGQLELLPDQHITVFTLDAQQLAVQNHILRSVRDRNNHYDTYDTATLPNQHDQSSDCDCDSDFDFDMSERENEYSRQNNNGNERCYLNENRWTTPILVTGKPGAGKTYTILSTIQELVTSNNNILVAAPTGFLASVYRALTDDEVSCDTVHAAFHIPVESNRNPSVNWDISRYEIVIIDEVSMISEDIFNHILKTLNCLVFRPVLVVCGDAAQQQPFHRANGKIMQLSSILDNRNFIGTTYHYNLQSQYRVGDERYLQFLDHIRHWIPDQVLLDELQDGHVITEGPEVRDDHIIEAYRMHPDTTILTFTRHACDHINNLMTARLFNDVVPMATVQLDNDLPPTDIYPGMRIVITQNRDKPNNVVNGQLGIVHTVQNNTVLLKLPTGNVVAVYPVTSLRNETRRTVYPFSPAYATTMCKAQGQTLRKAVLWFDIPKIPPGSAYVALSRVKKLDDIYFLIRLTSNFFTPVTRDHNLL